jgi:hypothetical protein
MARVGRTGFPPVTRPPAPGDATAPLLHASAAEPAQWSTIGGHSSLLRGGAAPGAGGEREADGVEEVEAEGAGEPLRLGGVEGVAEPAVGFGEGLGGAVGDGGDSMRVEGWL